MILTYCSETKKPYFENSIQMMAKNKIGIIPKLNYTSICKAYNEVIKESNDDLIVFSHNDVEILTRNWDIEIERIFNENENLGILGLVGCSCFSGDSWAGDNGISYGMFIQEHKYRNITPHLLIFSPYLINDDFAKSVTVDGLFIAIRKDRIKCVFDENLTGFHFYDVCFSVDNHLKGVDVGITYKVLSKHLSDGNYNSNWYDLRDNYIKNKYKNMLPIKIPCIFAGDGLSMKYKDSIKRRVFKEIENVKIWARTKNLH